MESGPTSEKQNDNRSGQRAVPLSVRPVRKAYEQVADQLRELIETGSLAVGGRLPTEEVLAGEFGVSRATVREALRVLAAQNLIHTTKGATGGSYVMLPTVDHISEFLGRNISLLTQSDDITLEEFLELRKLLEIFATRMAARHSSQEQLRHLEQAIPPAESRLGTRDAFAYNKAFHSAIIEACGNRLLYIATQPVFSVLQSHLIRSTLKPTFYTTVNEHHGRILKAISERDENVADNEMRLHLEYLSSVYEQTWRGVRRARSESL